MNNSKLKTLFITILTAYTITLLLRLLELPLWGSPHLHINGEPLLATHDAYGWIAGALGTGTLTGMPLSEILAALHALTGISLGSLSFCLPAILAPLVVIPVCLICAFLGMAEAGIVAGLFAGGAIGFLARTRLGFGDTDVLSLFFPFAVAAGLLWAVASLVNTGWRRNVLTRGRPSGSETSGNSDMHSQTPPCPPQGGTSEGQSRAEVQSVEGNCVTEMGFEPFSSMLKFAAVGLIAATGQWFYPSGLPVLAAMVGVYGIICLITAKSAQFRLIFLSAFPLFLMPWMGGLWGIAGAVLVLVLVRLKPEAISTSVGISLIWAIALTTLVLQGTAWSALSGVLDRILAYGKVAVTKGDDLIFPNRFLSVREVQNVDWAGLMSRIGINWGFFIAGALGCLFLALSRPLALMFLPLFFLALASVKMGNRFTMFGGPVVGIGVGACISLIITRISSKRFMLWFCHLGLAVVALMLLYGTVKRFRPAPIMPRVYAETLASLDARIEPDARLWQWWDYGYAAQYFAKRETLDDGASQKGLYPLALVHTTSSPLQAAQTMLMTTASEQAQITEGVANGTFVPKPDRTVQYYSTDPVLPLKKLEAPRKAQALMASLARETKQWPEDLPPQYLVLSWENLRLAYWISYFGNWDLATGKGVHGQVQRLSGQIRVDTKNGTLITPRGNIPMRTLDIINQKENSSQSWPHAPGRHVILNTMSKEVYLMDDTVYDSMMVRMLLDSPSRFDEWFELVEDRYPWNRVYRVRRR